MNIPSGRRGQKKSHKDRQRSHHKLNGKYVRQRIRTFRNKLRSWKRHQASNPGDRQFQAIYNSLISREA